MLGGGGDGGGGRMLYRYGLIATLRSVFARFSGLGMATRHPLPPPFLRCSGSCRAHRPSTFVPGSSNTPSSIFDTFWCPSADVASPSDHTTCGCNTLLRCRTRSRGGTGGGG